MMQEKPYTPCKKATLIKQKYMTQETAAQNIKNQFKSSIENKNPCIPVHG
jgi:hypothetical protein